MTALSPGQSPPPVSTPIRTDRNPTPPGLDGAGCSDRPASVSWMLDQRVRRFRARRLTALAAGGGAAAGLAIERGHLRRVAADPDYARLSAPLDGRQRSVRSADGTRLHVRTFGPDDAPTLVLAHGWTEELAFWSDVIRDLSARGLRLVAYDLRGHGDSGPATDGDYSLQRFGEDVEAILAACVAPGGRATVAGHSLGAMSIAAWAEHHDVRRHACGAALVNTGPGAALLFPNRAGRAALRRVRTGGDDRTGSVL